MKKLFAALAVITIVFSCKKEDPAPPPTTPTVTTAALANITTSGATAGGSIVSDGGATVTKSGIVWSKTNAIPTLTDSVVAGTTATGTFTSNLTGLDFNTAYYVRAFATNSVGTGYGSVVTLSTTNDDTKVRFTYNGVEVVYGIIVSPTTGKKWLDRNMGAQRVATASDDYQAYGDFFQWGRPADGHQLLNWTASNVNPTAVNGTTTTLATSDNPGHSNFIIAPYDATINPSQDWRSDNNSNRWVTNPQGPCPTGWHVPTINEWLAETSNTTGGTATSGGMTNSTSGYSMLKLTTPGYRRTDGANIADFHSPGSYGLYWSSSNFIYSNHSYAMDFLDGSGDIEHDPTAMSSGLSVRCIKDN